MAARSVALGGAKRCRSPDCSPSQHVTKQPLDKSYKCHLGQRSAVPEGLETCLPRPCGIRAVAILTCAGKSTAGLGGGALVACLDLSSNALLSLQFGVGALDSMREAAVRNAYTLMDNLFGVTQSQMELLALPPEEPPSPAHELAMRAICKALPQVADSASYAPHLWVGSHHHANVGPAPAHARRSARVRQSARPSTTPTANACAWPTLQPKDVTPQALDSVLRAWNEGRLHVPGAALGSQFPMRQLSRAIARFLVAGQQWKAAGQQRHPDAVVVLPPPPSTCVLLGDGCGGDEDGDVALAATDG
ncbi:unnamed protein product [Symbiodinium sp. KB8]|nr:unnamed protein product [Symbiodinium sp. KB8]